MGVYPEGELLAGRRPGSCWAIVMRLSNALGFEFVHFSTRGNGIDSHSLLDAAPSFSSPSPLPGMRFSSRGNTNLSPRREL